MCVCGCCPKKCCLGVHVVIEMQLKMGSLILERDGDMRHTTGRFAQRKRKERNGVELMNCSTTTLRRPHCNRGLDRYRHCAAATVADLDCTVYAFSWFGLTNETRIHGYNTAITRQ